MSDLKETLVGFIPKIIYKAISHFIDKQVWNGYFVHTSEMCNLVSREDANTIADYLYKKPVVKIIDGIKYELGLLGYGNDKTREFIRCFVEVAKDKNPLFYVIFQQKELTDAVNELESSVSSMLESISKIERLSPWIFDCYSIDDVDAELKNLSHGKIGIDFFNFDDSKFENEIRDKISKGESGVIRINGRYSEETFYATLFELKKELNLDYTQKVIVIRTDRGLKSIRDHNIPSDAIIVCNTCLDDDTPIIDNCLNIHIVSRVEKADISLRHRLKKATINALEKSGFSIEEAESIIDKNGNDYPLYKKALFNVTTNYVTNICRHINEKYISFALLFPRWSLSAKKDNALIEEFMGEESSAVFKALTPFSLDERPFVKKKADSYFGEEACVISFKNETLFCELKSNLEAKQIKSFWPLAKKVLLDVPSNFLDKNGLYSRNDDKCSESIRKGVLHSLIMLSIYFDQTIKEQVDSFVKSFIDDITVFEEIGHYRYLASILPELMESSPRIVFSFLSKSIKQKDDFYKLIISQKDNSVANLFSNAFDAQYVVHTLQLFLFLDDYKEEAIKLLFRIFVSNNSRNDKDYVGEAIANSLLAWIVMVPFTKQEKKKIVRWMFSYDASAAFLICTKLQYDIHCYVVHTNGPNYLQYPDFNEKATIDDTRDLFYYYATLLVKNALTPKQLITLIEKRVMLFYGLRFLKTTLNTIIKRVNLFSDDVFEKEEVANAIRHFITVNRRYSKADWASSESTIKLFEKALSKIVFKHPESEYIHLFIDQRINNPCPLVYDPEKKSGNFQKEEEKTREYIENKCDYFVDNGNDFNYLIRCLNKLSVNNASIPNHHIIYLFDKVERKKGRTKQIDIFYRLIKKINPHSTCISTVAYLTYKKFGAKSFFSIAKRLAIKGDNDRLINYLSRYQIDYNDNQYIDFIQSLNKQQSDLYFRSLRGYSNITRDESTLRFVLNGVKKLEYLDGEKNHYGSIVYYSVLSNEKSISLELALELLFDASESILAQCDDVGDIAELIKMLQEHFFTTNDDAIKNKIATLELLFGFGNSGGYYKPVFLLNYLAQYPQEYYSVIEKLFLCKDKTVEQGIYGRLYSQFLFVLNFCPGVINNVFHDDIFGKWISEFKKLVLSHGKTKENYKLFYKIIGKLCAYSPIDPSDGVMPTIGIREFIEKIPPNYFETFFVDFRASISNSIVGRIVSDGSDLRRKANKYKEQAASIRRKYKQTSSLLEKLYQSFEFDASRERKEAEDE